jgi:hypothetical protein
LKQLLSPQALPASPRGRALDAQFPRNATGQRRRREGVAGEVPADYELGEQRRRVENTSDIIEDDLRLFLIDAEAQDDGPLADNQHSGMIEEHGLIDGHNGGCAAFPSATTCATTASNSSTGFSGSLSRPVRLLKASRSSWVSSSPFDAISRSLHASQLSPSRTAPSRFLSERARRIVAALEVRLVMASEIVVEAGASRLRGKLGHAQLSLASADSVEDADQVFTRFHVPADDGCLRLFERELEAGQLA